MKTKQLSEELKATGEALTKTKEQFRKWRHSNKDNALTKDFTRLGGKSKAIPAKEFEKLMAQFLSEVLNKAKAKEVLKQESMDSKTEAFIQKERETNFAEICQHFDLKMDEPSTSDVLAKYVKIGWCTRKKLNHKACKLVSGHLNLIPNLRA